MKNRPDKPGVYLWETDDGELRSADFGKNMRSLSMTKWRGYVYNCTPSEFEESQCAFSKWLGQAHPPKKIKIYSVNMMTKDAASTYRTRAITRKMAAYEDIKEFLLEDDMTTDRLGVLAEILEERHRQDQKWGEQNHSPIEWQGILMEEVGEQAREANENHFEGKDSLVKYRKELVQVAAVAVNMIECLDRGKWEVQ